MASFRARLLDRALRILTARKINPGTDPRIIRDKINRFVKRYRKPPRGVTIEHVDIDGIPAEIITPEGRTPERTLLYLHGGGYILCSPDTHRPLVSALSKKSGSRALLIDYRLAPEHPFPAAIDDAVKAYRWLIAQGTDPKTITLAGDSAGGGLTMATLFSLRDAGDPMPAGAALLSPWTDLAMSGASHITHQKRDPMLSVEGALIGARHYLGGASPTNPLASPLYGNFDGLPPLFIHVGGNEILLDDSLRLAERAKAAGVEVTLKVWPDMPHVFQAARFLPEARSSVNEIAAFLARVPRKSDLANSAAD
ncbi:MAG: alpha/beta hydrolase [Parvibaculum sp.]|nr:alpha/beta hydrolase [Parvibaculum sp.]